MKAMAKRRRFLVKAQKMMKAKKKRKLFLSAMRVVGEWAKARVCEEHELDTEWDRELFLLIG